MAFQNWLKTLAGGFTRRSSRRDRRSTRLASGQVVLMREEFVCASPVETLESRKLLSVNPVLVADLVAGAGGSNPSQFVNVNGTLFFTANDGTNGYELWQSDGTSAGTALVKDIRSGNSGSNPGFMTNVNGTLFFRATNGVNGLELWQSDGTSDGTTLVKDIYSGSGSSDLNFLTNVNGTLFFSANDGMNGYELWQSDGTSNGTTLVKNIASGSSSSSPRYLTNVNGTLFFSAFDDVNGNELWQSDGTFDGTTLVKDIRSGSSSSYPRSLMNVNGTLYFRANDGTNGYELWQSDGTSAGTTLVKEIRSGSYGSSPNYLTNVNGTLFFSANDGVNGFELWQSDGTSAGTTLVKDIRSGIGSYPRYLTNVNGTLFFNANDGVNGYELWQSDGTSAGTTLVNDINAGSGNSSPAALTNVNGTLFFRANDGVNGSELWKAVVPADTPKVSVHAFSFLPPALVKDIVAGNTGSYPRFLTNVNGTLFFAVNDGTTGPELWQSDGTSDGTRLVRDIVPGSSGSSPLYLTNVNGILFFSANADVHGHELWQSDGTSAGTILVKDIRVGSSGSSPNHLTNVNGTLFFSANDGTNGNELWQSDGTSAGTTLVKNIRTGSSSSPSFLTNVNGMLFFRANDGTNGSELWQSDGTSTGTALVKDIRTGSFGSSLNSLVNVNGTLFFSATDGVNGYELWQSDGTSAGTKLVKDIFPGIYGSSPDLLTNVNGTLFFVANDGTSGYELWQSDGTSSGTTLVKDIISGISGSFPGSLTNVNGTLFFGATDGVNGYELWRSDGTSAGTTLADDINTGSGNSSPGYLTNVNGTLFFIANDGTYGSELWSMAANSNVSNSMPQLTAFSAAIDTTEEDSATEVTFAEMLAQSDATDSDGTVDAFIVQAISSGTLKIGTSSETATGFAVGSNDRIDATHNAYWTPNANASGSAIAAFSVLAQDNIGDNSINPVTAAVNVTAVADTPSVTNATTNEDVQTTSGLVISRNAVDGAEVTYFKITNITGGTLYQNDGTTQINDGDFVTYAEGEAGLKFTPVPDSTATGHFTVQASTSNLDTGLGGGTVVASIAVTPTVPMITATDPLTFAQRPTITWTAVSGSDHYVLYINNQSTGANPFVLRTVTGTSFTPTTDLGTGQFDVRVRALSASGDSSFYSQKFSFRISTPAVFTNIVRFQTSTTPTLSWRLLTGAVKYDLWIDNLSTAQSQVVRNKNVTGTSWTSPTNLPMGSYRAWIRGADASGLPANWSRYVDFFVLPPVTVVGPSAPTFDRTPTFRWNAVPGAVSYDLYYQNHTTGSAATSIANISGNSYTPPSNLADGNYRWYVLAVMQGNYRSQSATLQFSYVGGRPTILTPMGSTTDTTPTLTWTPVTGAVRYKLFVSRTDVPTNGVISQTSLTTPNFTPTTALPQGSYRAWVLAVSATGAFSLWSDPVSFTVTATGNDSPALPGELLLSNLTVLEDMSSQISKLASSDSVDVTMVSQKTDDVPVKSAPLQSEFGNDKLPRVAAISQSEPGRSRYSVSALSIAGDEAGVDALMADVPSMMSVFEI